MSEKGGYPIGQSAIVEKSTCLKTWFFPLLLIIVCGLCYGILAPQLGFYWDDWPAEWLYKTYGGEGLTRYYSTSRPLLGYFYLFTMPILGANPLSWQVFSIALRFGVGLVIWWVLRILWPHRPKEAKWVALLSIVFPGFTQQSISVIYSSFFLVLFMFFLSIGLMILAFENRKKFYLLVGISMLFSAINLFSMEYFFGLEFLRPFFIHIYLSNRYGSRPTLKRVFKLWWPYILVVIGYLYWRLYFQSELVSYEPRLILDILVDPSTNLTRLFIYTLETVVLTGFKAWLFPFTKLQLTTSSLWGIMKIITMMIGGGLVFGFFFAQRSSNREVLEGKDKWVTQALFLGFFALMFAGIPFAIADLFVKMTFPNDRFMLSFMFGSCLLVVALASLVRNLIARRIFLTLLLLVSVGYQFQKGLSFRDEWKQVRSFLRQLSWRAPALQPGTTLIADDSIFPYSSDYSITAPINWMYSNDRNSIHMDFLFAYVPHRVGRSIQALQPDHSITQSYSGLNFRGSTSQLLAVLYDPPACLKILDSKYDMHFPQLSPDIQNGMMMSNPDEIIFPLEIGAGGILHELISDAIDSGSWCYYFQKADLARQLGDWQEVSRLGDMALPLDDYSQSAAELAPFIEGYAHVGEVEKAYQLTMIAHRNDAFTNYMLCDLWWRVELEVLLREETLDYIKKVNHELDCR